MRIAYPTLALIRKENLDPNETLKFVIDPSIALRVKRSYLVKYNSKGRYVKSLFSENTLPNKWCSASWSLLLPAAQLRPLAQSFSLAVENRSKR